MFFAQNPRGHGVPNPAVSTIHSRQDLSFSAYREQVVVALFNKL
jgi:hypothetical protein